MDTWKDILDAAGPQAELARELGVTRGAVYLMRVRGSVAPRYWRALVRRLQAAGYEVSTDDLLALRERET